MVYTLRKYAPISLGGFAAKFRSSEGRISLSSQTAISLSL
jgi:hypothetical protein